jgi:hypothetical protein
LTTCFPTNIFDADDNLLKCANDALTYCYLVYEILCEILLKKVNLCLFLDIRTGFLSI